MKNITILLVSVFATALILPQQAFSQSEKTKSFNGVKYIRVTSSSGDLKIQKSKDATVTAYVRTTGDFDKSAEISMELDGDQLTLQEDHRERNTHGGAHWTLTIPDGIKVKMTTGSGSISAMDVKVDIKGTTGSGEIEFTKVSGTIEATTGSGNILLRDSNGEFQITTGSGSGTIQNLQGSIKLTCGSGNIRVGDSQAAFTMTTGSGTVTSKNITLNGSSKFTSGSGDTNVSLAASPKFNISITSGSGDAELNFNGNEIAGEIVMQANKGNGNIQAPFSFDKVEEIDNGGKNNITVRKTAVKGGGSNLIKISTGSGNAVLTK